MVTTLDDIRRQDTEDILSMMDAVEPDEDINDRQREKIRLYAEKHGGECWLGNVNLHAHLKHKVLDKWDGGPVSTFEYKFAVPRYDETLYRMIRDRDNSPYTTTAADAEKVDAIFKRIDELGGIHLFWY